MAKQVIHDITLKGSPTPHQEQILTPEALDFVARLHRQFNERRLALLARRQERQILFDKGQLPDFLPETAGVRQDARWRVAAAPKDLLERKVEITGPVERKMMINAFNSGASVFMADFEDALSPTWHNVIEGQFNLIEAVGGTLSFTSPEGKQYTLKPPVATLMVRPRGWHLPEKHLLVGSNPISASLFDFGLYFFHNVKKLIDKESGPYFYLPKMESHLEARLWNDVFNFAQDATGIPKGSVRATVLIETIPAAFEMEEILYELRDHSAGLNAGRWDYIFSIIKKFHRRPDALLPDRSQVTMTVPFMRAYTELLVKTCHSRGAFAMGGMAAFVPSRKDPEVNAVAMEKVREDKRRESKDGFDGTWVAHPDLVPVAKEIFTEVLNTSSNQLSRLRDDVQVTAKDLLNFAIPGSTITEKGFRQNVNVAMQYLSAWLNGLGAVALFNLMEDAATAEISRAQLWQWLHTPGTRFESGQPITDELYQQISEVEYEHLKKEGLYKERLNDARKLLDELVLSETFAEFLTLKAYHQL
ncbi:MAG: malate synthase A [Parachlamydia sp.]|nr:malate synthase A [Parachlamydia sp.]